MPQKNGPASLAAYHKLVLEQERNKGKKPMVTATSFDTESMDPETATEAARRVASILGKPETSAPEQGNAPAPTPEAPRKPRRTVAGILQGLQDKERTLSTDIDKLGSIIASYEKKRDETKYKLSVLQEMMAEITSEE